MKIDKEHKEVRGLTLQEVILFKRFMNDLKKEMEKDYISKQRVKEAFQKPFPEDLDNISETRFRICKQRVREAIEECTPCVWETIHRKDCI